MTKVIPFLIPPANASGPEVVRWRLSISFAMFLVGVHIAWACGLLPGLSGFAQASEVRAVDREVTIIRRELLETRIFDTTVKLCMAMSESRPEVKQFYSQKQRDLLTAYRDLTSRDPRVPDCREVI